jgi:hypothetical protein
MQRCCCLAASIAILGLAASSASADERAVYQYIVEHPSYGTIGTYTDTVEQKGDVKRIDTQLRVAVRVLGIPMHREEADRTEEWRGDHLVAFHSITVTNGNRIEVNGRAQGKDFVITSPHGTTVVPGDVYPSTPWAARWASAVPRPAVLMSTKSGDLKPVRVSETDKTVTSVDGIAMPAQHFRILTDKDQEVWLSEKGVPLRFSTVENGTPINFVLAPSTSAAIAQAH